MKLSDDEKYELNDHPEVTRTVAKLLRTFFQEQVDRLGTTPLDREQLLIERAKLEGMKVLVARLDTYIEKRRQTPLK